MPHSRCWRKRPLYRKIPKHAGLFSGRCCGSRREFDLRDLDGNSLRRKADKSVGHRHILPQSAPISLTSVLLSRTTRSPIHIPPSLVHHARPSVDQAHGILRARRYGLLCATCLFPSATIIAKMITRMPPCPLSCWYMLYAYEVILALLPPPSRYLM